MNKHAYQLHTSTQKHRFFFLGGGGGLAYIYICNCYITFGKVPSGIRKSSKRLAGVIYRWWGLLRDVSWTGRSPRISGRMFSVSASRNAPIQHQGDELHLSPAWSSWMNRVNPSWLPAPPNMNCNQMQGWLIDPLPRVFHPNIQKQSELAGGTHTQIITVESHSPSQSS